MPQSTLSKPKTHNPHLRLIRDEDAPAYDADFEPETVPEKREAFGMIPWELYDRLAGDGDAQAVLMALVRHANAEGECWPSVATLCTITGKSDKHVRVKLDRLVELNIITKQPRRTGGMKSVNVYRIFRKVPEVKIGTENRTFGMEYRTVRYGVPDRSVPGTDRTITSELEPIELDPPVVPQERPKKMKSSYPEDFVAFWSAYKPHDTAARTVLREAAKVWEELAVEDRAAALEAVPVFAAGRDWREGYVPGAQVFLRKRRWENPPAPVLVGVNGNGRIPSHVEEDEARLRVGLEPTYGYANGGVDHL